MSWNEADDFNQQNNTNLIVGIVVDTNNNTDNKSWNDGNQFAVSIATSVLLGMMTLTTIIGTVFLFTCTVLSLTGPRSI